MPLRHLLLLLGVCQSAILSSKDVQMEISSKYFTPRDLLKTGLVDKNWIGVEKVFTKITPNAGLFEHKEKNEILFETNENSWTQIELIENCVCNADEYNFGYNNAQEKIRIEKNIETRNWKNLYRIFAIYVYWELKYHGRLNRRFKELLEDFLKALAEIVDVNAVDETQSSSFDWATLCNSVGVMEILLKRNGANPNQRDANGWTSLHEAAVFDRLEIINLLLNHGAEIDATDDELRSPLMVAVFYGHSNAAKILLSHQADPSLKDENGWTPLHKAAGLDRLEIIELLLNHGAEIDATDNELRTPLMKAVLWRHCNAAEILLSHQANPNMTNIYGETALDIAVDCGRCDAAKILLSHKANPNLRNKHGETTLECVVNRRKTDLVKVLLKHRADGNIVSASQSTQINLVIFYRDSNSAIILSHQIYQFVKMLLKSKPNQILCFSAFLVFLVFLFSF